MEAAKGTKKTVNVGVPGGPDTIEVDIPAGAILVVHMLFWSLS